MDAGVTKVRRNGNTATLQGGVRSGGRSFRISLLAGASLSTMLAWAVPQAQAGRPTVMSPAWLAQRAGASGRGAAGAVGVGAFQMSPQSLQNVQQSITNLRSAAQA